MIVQKDLSGKVLAEFHSKAAAARAIGIDESAIRRSIKWDRMVRGQFRYSYSNQVTANKPYVHKSPAKILIVDIETAPNKGYVWGFWQQNMYLDQVISTWFMLTWSAKWLGEPDVMSDKLTPKEVSKEKDKRIVKSLWALLDEADIVIAHNGNKFDIPKMNSRFVVNGMYPPSPYKQIDTLQIARSQFSFPSNKLQGLAELFGYEGKFDTDFELWARCMDGEQEALDYMSEYNDQDVLVLEKVYLKLRPYAKGHPNLDLYVDSDKATCPHCGSSKINKIEGKYFYTQAVRYDVYRCECGAISRSKTGNKYTHKKQISSIPR